MSISLSLLQASATPGATFWSGQPKLARNSKGTMAGYITTRDPNPAYVAQRIEIKFWADGTSPDTAAIVFQGTYATNAPSICAGQRNGEFFAVFSDWANNLTRVLIWPDITANRTPQHWTYPGHLGGKWSAAFDQGLQRLFIIGQGQGSLRQILPNGKLYSDPPLFNPAIGPDSLQYPGLQMGPDNQLCLAWCSGSEAQPGTTSYGAVGIMTRDQGASWYGPRAGALLNPAQPPVYNAAAPALLAPNSNNGSSAQGLEDFWPSTLLSGYLIDDKYLHLSYARTGDFGGKFIINQGRDTTTVYQRWDRDTGKLLCRDESVSAGDFRPVLPGMFLCRRRGALYSVCLEHGSIVLMRSDDNGDHWAVVTRYVVPPFETGSTMLQYLTGMVDGANDGSIEAVVTSVNCSWAEWSNSALAWTSYAPSKVWHLKIEVPA